MLSLWTLDHRCVHSKTPLHSLASLAVYFLDPQSVFGSRGCPCGSLRWCLVAQDVLDGNETRILGLLWSIISVFSIRSINLQMPGCRHMGDLKQRLLAWAQVIV